MTQRHVLLIGYGNPGRLDDGLGPACAEALEQKDVPCLRVESNYQLCIEDAREIADSDMVIFADAAMEGPAPYSFCRVYGREGESFSSHALQPETLLAASESLFGHAPKAFMLRIRGYEFDEFGEELSSGAKKNLEEAVAFVRDFVINRLDGSLN